MTTNAEAVGDALAAHGVTTVFGLMGNGNLELIADLVDRKKMAYVAVRHENAAVAAADGHARAGERLGLATVTHGPGFTNALTALVTARRARTPLLLIAGNASGYSGRSTQRLDQRAAAEALGVPVFTAAETDDWAAVTAGAIAATRDGAVVLDLPANLMRADARTTTPGVPPPLPPSPPVDRDAVRRAGALLAAAERPLIVGGRGMLRAGARDAVAVLGERMGARLGTSLAAKGAFSGRAGDIGLVGGLASPESMAACRDADVVLAVGASLNGFTTEHATLMRTATVVRIDIDPGAPSSIPVALTIGGDAAGAVAALAREIDRPRRQPWPVDAPKACTPRSRSDRVAEALDRLLPVARTAVFDHGDRANAAISFIAANDPTQSIFPVDFGSLGLSVAAAIGAATARPDRRTVAICGDGGLMMQLAELDTLARTGIPVLVVVFNDGIYGAEYPHLKAIGASLAPATFASRPIAGMAAAMGLAAHTLRPDDDPGSLAAIVADTSRPSLVEVICPPSA